MTEVERLQAELEQERGMRAEIAKLYTENCAVLHDYIQEFQIGLGGENIFELVVKDARELRKVLEDALERVGDLNKTVAEIREALGR